MRVVIKFSSRAHAELLAELEQMPSRERAERLRLLASIGLVFMKSGQASFVGLEQAINLVRQRSDRTGSTRFGRVRERLRELID
jgi:tRNA A37 methylthiotransferase MiaB